MNIPYTFHNKLVLRSPRFSFVPTLHKNIISDLLENNTFLEAIYLASPILYDECIKLKENNIKTDKEIRKINAAIIKYYQRMYSRCTPFGLFSGCTLVNWSDDETNILYNEKDIFRSTRLDMHFLCDLSQKLTLIPVIRNRLHYSPNSSIYKLADEVCYIEYKYIDGKRQHRISAVSYSDYLELMLKSTVEGITIDEMVQLLTNKTDVSKEEASVFINELIQEQVLVSELEPAITGKEFLHQILEILHRINQDKNHEITYIINLLGEIEEKIKNIDTTLFNDVSIYKDVIDEIKKLNIPFEEGKLFQTDLFRKSNNYTLSNKIQKSLLQAFSFLNGLYSQDNNDNLATFTRKFQERYDEKEMPLLTVLDAETGIEYANNTSKDTPLLEDLIFPTNNNAEDLIQWNKAQIWLLKKLELAFKRNLYEIEISEEDINQFPPKWDDLSPSVSIFFKLVDNNRIILENIGGSSAANLLGRFAHGHEDINKLVKDIVHEEEKQNNEVIFAEIVHLPENRTGNVLLHPAFRQYEIPFLAKSSLPSPYQIALSDLYISVQNGYIRLFSKSLNREVIPRLSNAHNFSYKSLPIYHFLCDLQTQKLRKSFMFNWGTMASQLNFLPRVVYKDVILFEASWKLYKKDFEEILKETPDNNSLAQFLKKWKIPRYVVLVDGDNKLLIDFKSKSSIESFLHTIKTRPVIILKEFHFADDKIVKDGNGNFYINEFIAPLIKTEKVYTSDTINLNKHTIQRNFSPGSEWIYYKLYCGVKSADKILLELIYPLVVKFLSDKKMDKWFFIRYNDPEFHLRLRFHLTDKNSFGDFVQSFSASIVDFESENIIWKTDLTTYQREINRYTPVAMELSESLFFIDSMQKLFFLRAITGDERENIRWLWGIKIIDQILCAFNFSLQEKYILLKTMKDNFAKEFNATTPLFQQLNKKYRSYKPKIEKIMNDEEMEEVGQILNQLFDKEKYNFESIATQILALFENNKINLINIVSSYVHMSLNRLFISNPRTQEMIVYDFLFQYYNGEIKRKNS